MADADRRDIVVVGGSAGGIQARVEVALWAAMRALEENGRIAERLARSANERGEARSAEYHGDRSLASQRHAEVLRGLLQRASHLGQAAEAEPIAAK